MINSPALDLKYTGRTIPLALGIRIVLLAGSTPSRPLLTYYCVLRGMSNQKRHRIQDYDGLDDLAWLHMCVFVFRYGCLVQEANNNTTTNNKFTRAVSISQPPQPLIRVHVTALTDIEDGPCLVPTPCQDTVCNVIDIRAHILYFFSSPLALFSRHPEGSPCSSNNLLSTFTGPRKLRGLRRAAGLGSSNAGLGDATTALSNRAGTDLLTTHIRIQ